MIFLSSRQHDLVSSSFWMGPGSETCASRLAGRGLTSSRLEGVAGASPPDPTAARHALYEGMASALLSTPLQLDGPAGTQGHALGELFRTQGGTLVPVLMRLEVPVRALVAPIGDEVVARRLLAAVQAHVQPLLAENGLWMQDPRVYHATIFHASTHADPRAAPRRTIDAEVGAASAALDALCPMRTVLERVVATPGGALVACWQLLGGAEPARLRTALRAALPEAPTTQTVREQDILHTTLARLVAPPGTAPDGTGPAARLHAAAEAMTRDLCGLQLTLDRLWFVEEHDLLALALGGRYRKRALPLACSELGGDGQSLADNNYNKALCEAAFEAYKQCKQQEPELAAAPLKNQEIRAEEVRLVYPEAEGKATEVVALGDALAAARTRQLDLIMVSAVARPPVVRIADFDKVLYEMRKKAKTAAKQQREQQRLADPKEVRIGCRAAPNDLALKVGRARAFLEEGQHLRLSVLFKGARELAEARGVVLSILAHLEGVAVLKDIKHLEKAFKNQWGVQLAPVGQGMGGKAESIVAQLAEAERLYARAQALRAAQGWRPPPLHANAVRGPLANAPGP
ncbi:Translation initiation factor IF-3 [Auxenochlorella protothecoides]|uniref:Translation initiation factor IF-3 n=1 Tax=Auxenochlorella protothecoides TaxID=3075 RepID=A0A087SGI5_AUXPR|nr:Translation initiation factor IF-3 [Auxenochlorella protothecoides]KFM24839.1 Translation initiation factor IF-3 [Auxenochlorella protothecoides]